jgi:hypothetical protein
MFDTMVKPHRHLFHSKIYAPSSSLLPYIFLNETSACVKPILMYGCEVWGFANNSVIESFCLQFYKYIFGLKKSTPNCVLYGELGRFSIDIEIKSRMVAFWKRIICNKQDKIAVTLYKLLYKMHLDNLFHSK